LLPKELDLRDCWPHTRAGTRATVKGEGPV
jgi:hypothetical protein